MQTPLSDWIFLRICFNEILGREFTQSKLCLTKLKKIGQ